MALSVNTNSACRRQVVSMSRREADRFFVQLTGQPWLELFEESEYAYFLKVVDAQITVETGAEGYAGALVLHQAGRDRRARAG